MTTLCLGKSFDFEKTESMNSFVELTMNAVKHSEA